MKVLLAIGNYPSKYQSTRHNFGFLLLDVLQKKYGFSDFRSSKKFFAQVSFGEVKGEKIMFVKPQTLVNLSGKSVRAIFNFFKLDLEDMIVFCDDLSLSFGEVKFKASGSSGGHNGLKSIISALGSQKF